MKLGGSAPLVIAVLAHGANAACLGSCPARDASPLRVRFVTHGAQADGFWQSMRANAVLAASTFGASFDPVADWVWYQGDAEQESTYRGGEGHPQTCESGWHGDALSALARSWANTTPDVFAV